MGGFARIALPVAASFAAPYAGAALGLGTSTAAAGTSSLLSKAFTSAIFSGINQIGSLRQQRAQQRAAQARTQAEAARIQREFEIRERNRRERLRKTVAAQRARFGAIGIGSAGGSAAAIITGLQRKAVEDSRFDLEGVSLRRSSLLEASRPAARNNFRLLQKTISPFISLLD